MKSIVAIVGPTASGKTEASLKLAQRVGAEIVNADSRQVYRYLDIGTAKPSPEERSIVPHHLFDIVDPDEEFSLSIYQSHALKAIKHVHEKERIPILVGGSGQYIWSILEGWGVPEVPPDESIRNELEQRFLKEGPDFLYHELKQMDAGAAEQIDPRNIRRVIRALEVCRITGKRFSDLKTRTPPDFDIRIYGVTTEREDLYKRIDTRVDGMIEQGFVEEVKDLLDKGYSVNLPSMSSLGYREIAAYIHGETDLLDACQQIKYATHRFARHQYNWFRLNDQRIQWITTGQVIEYTDERVR